MQELLTQHPAILIVILGLSVAEWGWARFIARRPYVVAASAASLGVAVGQALIKPLSAGLILGTYTMFAGIAPLHFPLTSAWTRIGGFLSVEFAYYWFHR